MNRSKAKQADCILPTMQGFIVGAFVADDWLDATEANFPGAEDSPGRLASLEERPPSRLRGYTWGSSARRVPQAGRRQSDKIHVGEIVSWVLPAHPCGKPGHCLKYPIGCTRMMVAIRQTEVFATWLRNLRDRQARARIQVRIDRLQPRIAGGRKIGRRRSFGIANRLRSRLPSLFYAARTRVHRPSGWRRQADSGAGH